MRDTDIAWLAGIIEGEGSIAFHGKTGVRITVTMTDEDVVRRCHSITGVGYITTAPGRLPGYKRQWRWQVSRAADVARIMCAVAPELGERRRARALAAADRLAERLLIKHGTEAGYVRERRLGRETCRACKDAAAAIQRRRAHLRRSQAALSEQSGYDG